MRFGIVSAFGCGLSWWMRLQDEGHDVRVWIEPKTHKRVGDGIVPKSGAYDDLLKWVKEDPTAVMLFDSSGLGDKADSARAQGVYVVCGGTFMDRLEKDRLFGEKIAAEMGCTLPQSQSYPSFEACRSACASIDYPIYFKSDRYIDCDATHSARNGEEMVEYLDDLIARHGGHGKCLLQRKIDGVPLSTARWWNGSAWVSPYMGTYENKKLMNDDVGPSTGCALNVVWFYEDEDPTIAQQLKWDALTPIMHKNHAPPGLYDINAIVDGEGTAYFLEWTARLGYDSEMTSAYLIEELGDFLEQVAVGGQPPTPLDDLAYGVRLSVPPYPSEDVRVDDKASPDGIQVHGIDDDRFVPYCLRYEDDGTPVLSGNEGLVGLAIAVGPRLKGLHEEAMDYLKGTLRVPGLMYRTDGAKDIKEAALKLMEAGLDVPSNLAR